MVRRVRMRISGRVQGVFYRKSTEEKARALGLSGWVRNMPDGSVETFAVGDQALLEAFIAWCKDGPPMARVDEVALEWRDSEESSLADDERVEQGSEFSVRRSSY